MPLFRVAAGSGGRLLVHTRSLRYTDCFNLAPIGSNEVSSCVDEITRDRVVRDAPRRALTVAASSLRSQAFFYVH